MPQPVLTANAPDPLRPGYRLLEVDRGRFASLPEEQVAPLGLEPGGEIPAAQFARLAELADAESAYRAGLRMESLRPHARQDLARRLRQKQHSPAAIAAALDRLASEGALDDGRFARHYAATRAARGRGPARLIRDLQQQGIERPLAEAVVREVLAEEGIDPDAQLRRIAERRASQVAGLPGAVRRRRLVAFLSRRGFDAAQVRRVVEEVVAGDNAGP